MSHHAPLLHIDCTKWFQAIRDVTNATNERTVVGGIISESALGHNGTAMDYNQTRAIASALVLANMNSIPFDWAARLSVGGTHMSFFIVKQLPVLPPERYLEEAWPGKRYAELVVPLVLELTYTADDMRGFALDLGYEGAPFVWDEERRHCLKCELDAIFAHMYGFDRADLGYILDAPPPGATFPTLKRNEMKEFGEYRTKRYVLEAFDWLVRGEVPDLGKAPTA